MRDVEFGGRLVQLLDGVSAGDSAGRKVNVSSVGALRRTRRRPNPSEAGLSAAYQAKSGTASSRTLVVQELVAPEVGMEELERMAEIAVDSGTVWLGDPPHGLRPGENAGKSTSMDSSG